MVARRSQRLASNADSQPNSGSVMSRRLTRASVSVSEAQMSTSQGPSQADTPVTEAPPKEFMAPRSQRLASKTSMVDTPLTEDKENPEVGIAGDSGVASTHSRRGRGPSKGKTLAPPLGQKWQVKYDKHGKPIGVEGKKLHRKVGQYARDPRYCPLVFAWRDVPPQGLESLWENILMEYDFGGHPNMKEHVFSIAHDRWRDWKCYLKKDIWAAHKGDMDKMSMKLGGRVVEEQFQQMIHYWESEEGKKVAEKNSKNRALKTMKHHSGSVTFAQIGGDMAKDGEEPEDIDVFIKAYTPKDPTGDLETREILYKIQASRETQASQGRCTLEPILTEVIGQNKGKKVRGLGGHHRNRDIGTSAGQHREEKINEMLERNRMVEEELVQQSETYHERLDIMENLLTDVCAHALYPVPTQPNQTPEERRPAADEESSDREEGMNPDASIRNRKGDIVTPVRRSSRIRNRAMSS